VKRTLFTEDHEDFRAMVRDFLAREVVPVFPQWLEQELIPRDFFRSIAKIGMTFFDQASHLQVSYPFTHRQYQKKEN